MSQSRSNLDFDFSQFFSTRKDDRVTITISSADAMTNLILSNENAQTLIVPENLDERGFPVGAHCNITIPGAFDGRIRGLLSTVLVNGAGAVFRTLPANYGMSQLRRIAMNEYILVTSQFGATAP